MMAIDDNNVVSSDRVDTEVMKHSRVLLLLSSDFDQVWVMGYWLNSWIDNYFILNIFQLKNT